MKNVEHSHPKSMAKMENIFSALVFGATLPNPILVRLVNVKYNAVMYFERISGPLVVSLARYGIFIVTASLSNQLIGTFNLGLST